MAKQKDNPNTKSRLIGTAIPVSALRSEKSIGVGEFADLAGFGDACVKLGIGLVQILPVNDTGFDSSPYAALTAFGLHPLYLRIEDINEAESFSDEINDIRNRFNQEIRFPYEALLRAKINLLKKIYGENKALIMASPELISWIDENPWVKSYSVFRQLKEANGEKSWKDWAEYVNANPAQIASLWEKSDLREGNLFWAWLQLNLDIQFTAAAESLTEKGILLEGDLPILMNEDSCDVWAHRENFHLELSAGAPPDMYSPEGQNWGFPTYNWDAQSKDNFSWWKARLKAAEKYYDAYRIDHVLGFFRIWSSRREDHTALMGRYIPYNTVNIKDLKKLKYDEGRIRWITQPHISTSDVWKANASDAFDTVLDRIGEEELWLFNKSIKCEKDITSRNISDSAKGFLMREWGNRILFEYKEDEFYPVWYYRESRAYASFSGEEKKEFDALLNERNTESEAIWEKEGRKLLSVLIASSAMLPCAEDLGAVPPCVPKVLTELNILGLRVVRWHREWDKPGEPYVPFEDYPELSVCTPAVHDSSCLREWWDKEANQESFCDFLGVPSLPKIYNPGVARFVLGKIASAASRFRVFQIQDLLHLSNNWYAADPASERINVPGTTNEFNWTYRLPASIDDIMKDSEFVSAVNELSLVKPAQKKKKNS